jgi:hypothetical protein
MRFFRFSFSALLLGSLTIGLAHAAEPTVFVDDHGVMRYTNTQAEVAVFGVNYSAPFAHGYRALQRLGVPLEAAIDADVYHFSRLGFNVYRIHVWDREISDEHGNLLVNDHVRAFDYLLAQLKQRGIKIVLTPLQFGTAGYPEPGVPLPGFSSRYGKQGSLENRESWPLQERYLQQFMEHVNPHTGLAYKDDPDVIAVEINNEPGHFEYDLTLEYINQMVAAVRRSGYKNPILYNMSHGIPVHQAYLDAEVQGGTFQWYPSNLVAGHEQRGNFLPYVDRYPIPFTDHPQFQRIAKVVYEFDPADIGRAYIYPAMARSFRSAGFQIAAQFAYDPMHLAPYNTEYQTHYLNLAYSPQKALGMMIAGEAFRRVPLGQDYGRYPHNTSFAGFRLHYPTDLAEFVDAEHYLHSSGTNTPAPAPERLSRIAGYGSSPLVDYPGRGAYFLDRLAPGVWRLEVMPDALWVRDPFEKASPLKAVAKVAWNKWPMKLALADLGSSFNARGLNRGNTTQLSARQGAIEVTPGVYLLVRDGVDASGWNAARKWNRIRLGEFSAPPPAVDAPIVVHTPAAEASAGSLLRLPITLAAPTPPERVELIAHLPPAPRAGPPPSNPRAQPGGGNTPGPGQPRLGGGRLFAFRHLGGLDYAAEIPADLLHPGQLRYHIAVTTAEGTVTYPSALPVHPADWRFYGEPWEMSIVPAQHPVVVFEASQDAARVTAQGRDVRYPLAPTALPGGRAMRVFVTEFQRGQPDHSLRFFFKDRITPRIHQLPSTRRLVVLGRSALNESIPVQLALITEDGIAYGALVELGTKHAAHSVELSELRQVRAPNIPHGYPSFIPFWSEVATAVPFDVTRAESVLISIGPGLTTAADALPLGVEIERIWLE